ncbi:hypothetical protein HYY70_00710 [Candidatus Woesearchaeota archaeon]|nr:hypothetical protein [Candidatus Woesearchaeota archaeon]
MVNISLKLFLLSFVIFVLLINVGYAAGSKLIFSDVDVRVGSKTSKNLVNGENIDEEAEPGDTVEFRVEVKNNFTDAEDLDIDDIRVEVTIEEIDDGDDFEEESSEFDLGSGNDKRVNLKFEVPLEVEEDTFDVEIRVEGEDENNTNHEATMKLKLEVDKENHLLKITRKSLSPAEVACNRKNIQLGVSVLNIGSEDEEDVSFQVLNSDLGIDLKDDVGELEAEPNEETSKFSKIYTFNAPTDAEAGSYPVILRALYDDGRKKAEETVTLTVNECATATKETSKEPEEESSEEDEDVELITPTTGKTTVAVVQPAAPPEAVVTQESFFKSNAFVTGIIIAEIVVVIVGIVLVATLFRRKG